MQVDRGYFRVISILRGPCVAGKSNAKFDSSWFGVRGREHAEDGQTDVAAHIAFCNAL